LAFMAAALTASCDFVVSLMSMASRPPFNAE
jgi:hypothetical protein